MGIRETLNENPSAVLKGAVGVLILAVVLAIYHFWPSGKTKVSGKEFFSDDDGGSWFADDRTKIPPFDHNGKEAVLARVFVCADGHKFVGYLQKFSPAAKSQMETAQVQVKSGMGTKDESAMDPRTSVLYKKPHEAKWVTPADAEYKQVKEVQCPGGGTNYQPVSP